MQFFSTVQYASDLMDDSWTSYAESIADLCRAPGRWVAADLWGGGKKIVIKEVNQSGVRFHAKTSDAAGFQRVVRLVIGLVCALFGTLLALPFMAVAYLNEEIRLKHKIAAANMTPEDIKRLSELVEERQRLAKERQGCEPISCLLLSICCLLCCLVCRQSK